MTYTPDRTAQAEIMVQFYLKQQHIEPLDKDVPVVLTLLFILARPKSKPKKVRYPTVRPDVDQYIKWLMDAIEGYIYTNDSQVIRVDGTKDYGSPPRVEIQVDVLGGT